MSRRESTRVVVIGAGQAGLSVAYYLRRFALEPGEDFRVLDRGPRAGGAWQHRWEALRLGSAHRVNDLPGMDALGLSFATADRERPAREVVTEYYQAYEEHYGLQVQRPVEVTAVTHEGADLLVHGRTAEGPLELTTQVLVNATGTWGAPFVPWYPGADRFRGRQLTTASYRAAEELAGQDVVVVGGGTSAIGFVLELEGVAARTTWVSRRPIDFTDQEALDPEAGAAAVAAQDRAAREGRALPSIVSGTGVPKTRRIAAALERGVLVARPMFDRIEENGVRWAAARWQGPDAPDENGFLHADAIIWATGFRPELRHLAPLHLREKAGGVRVENGAAWTDPRIFLAGYGPQASTIGASRAGRIVARQVIALL